MKVLTVHNYYQQAGGEDRVFLEEADLLEANGHEVVRYSLHNERVATMNPVTLAKNTLWSAPAYKDLDAIIRREQPHVAHFHNTFPLVSPAGYYAARSSGVPVVQTLHNYRLLCPNALFYRDGGPCEDCLGRAVTWPGVVHGCYRGSPAASAVVTAMLSAHRAARTWARTVDAYVALTGFARRKFVEGGLPAEKIVVKPNFVRPDPGPGEGLGGFALFVGRLSPEKGVDTLLKAWSQPGERLPLRVVGDGPLAARVLFAARQPNVEYLGHRSPEEVRALMKEARLLVFPSEWYETFGRVAAEAFAAGTPVVAADIGAVAEIVDDGRTGLRFRPGDAGHLAEQVERILSRPEEYARMRREARAEFEAKYTAERNYGMLMRIYESVLERTGVPA